jgi:hypothetical protein
MFTGICSIEGYELGPLRQWRIPASRIGRRRHHQIPADSSQRHGVTVWLHFFPLAVTAFKLDSLRTACLAAFVPVAMQVHEGVKRVHWAVAARNVLTWSSPRPSSGHFDERAVSARTFSSNAGGNAPWFQSGSLDHLVTPRSSRETLFKTVLKLADGAAYVLKGGKARRDYLAYANFVVVVDRAA